MKWAVEIKKTSLERRNLADLLQGLGFEIVKGADFEALYAHYFDNLVHDGLNTMTYYC